MLDKQASPLLYKANALQFNLGYERKGAKSRFGVTLSPAIGNNLPEKYGSRTYGDDTFSYTVASAFYRMDATINYSRLLSKQESKLKLSLGGGVGNSLSISDAIANFYAGTNILALHARLQVEYLPAPKHLLSLHTSTPVIAAVTRHIYANYPKSAEYNNLNAFFRQGTQLAAPTQLNRVELQVDYKYNLSQRLAAGVTYEFNWFSYSEPRPIHSYTQSALLQTTFTF